MSSVKGILDMIEAKTGEKAEKMIKEAEELREMRLKEAREKAAALADSAASKAEKEQKAELARHEATAKLRAKYRALDAKESLIRDVLDSATKVAKKEIEGKNCKEILMGLAVEGGAALGSQSLELVLPEKQKVDIGPAEVAKAIARATGVKVSVTLAKETVRSSGGLIIRTTDQSKSVNNTIEGRTERLSANIRDMAAKILFGEKAASN
jgi:vacuolar-type H+-ATPase subunit E/Vma4